MALVISSRTQDEDNMLNDVSNIGYIGGGYKEDRKGQVDLSLDEYREIARRLIISMRHKFGPVCNSILNSEDAMTNITTQIMLADWKFDGRGSKKGYRKSIAHYAIMSFITKNNKGGRHIGSLNAPLSSMDDSSELIKVIQDKMVDQPSKAIEDREFANYLMNCPNLTDKQRDCTYKYYIEDRNMQDIADESGITREAVRQSIRGAMAKMKGKSHEEGVTA